MRRIGWAAAVAAVALALGACSGGTTGGDSTTDSDTSNGGSATPTASEADSVLQAADVPYHDDTSREWLEPVLDVWAPADAEDLPVVVMFHGGTGNVSKDYLMALASWVAQQGAVVFVPNHSTTSMTTDVQETLAIIDDELDGAACAVAYAVAHAGEYGGDPETLVIFGHSAGATLGSTVAFRTPGDFPACGVELTPFDVDGLVAWDGDYLMMGGTAADDLWGDGVGDVVARNTLWRWLEDGERFPVTLVNGERAIEQMVRELPDSTGDWLARRDPDGAFEAEFAAIGALDDSAINVGELSDLLAARMTSLGFDVEQILLPESGHEWSQTSEEAKELLVEAIHTVADR